MGKVSRRSRQRTRRAFLSFSGEHVQREFDEFSSKMSKADARLLCVRNHANRNMTRTVRAPVDEAVQHIANSIREVVDEEIMSYLLELG